ncbi:hypothetical protein CNR22_01575 [Sphingobacteriaceae bacterium]|nr:hypothetical protein CNR22_01575 [Sphingobacteriaceae bacterium]
MGLVILVPTDFSRAARNAINYATEMAKRMKAKLVLLHVYLPPVPVSEVPMIIPLPAESETYILKKLKRIKNDLLLKRGNKNLEIETVCTSGVPVDEIYLYSLSQKVDFVVMGMQGKGFLKEKLMGSTTTSLIQKCEVPVLTIDKSISFKNPKKIVFASDSKGIFSRETLHPLSQVCSVYRSHIYVLNVVISSASLPGADVIHNKNIRTSFRNFDHSIHQIISVSVQQGLSDFVAAKHMDMIVMIPHHHSLIERVMVGRQTKEMAFHSTVPLLTLHEKLML